MPDDSRDLLEFEMTSRRRPLIHDQALLLLVAERDICRRAQRVWRIASVVCGAALGLAWWPLGLAAFLACQFAVYATQAHSVRSMELETGLDKYEQAAHLSAFDAAQKRSA